MKAEHLESLLPEEVEVIKTIRTIHYGLVETVIHQGRITEIRQTRRTRLAEKENLKPTIKVED